MTWTFVNTHFFKEGAAVLQTNDLALQRGYGVFDYLRTANNQPLFIDDYLDRFLIPPSNYLLPSLIKKKR